MNWTFAGLLTALGLTATGCRSEAAMDSAGVEAGAADRSPAVIQHVDAAGAARLLADKRVVVLDVRTPREFGAGHLQDARLMDFHSADFAAQLAKLDRSSSYLVHCATGRRSTSALKVFKKLGFQNVTHLDGGLKAWVDAGQPVQR